MSNIADLRDERNFPTFISCPHDNSINLDYFNIATNYLYPKRHWCLLAEIVEAGCLLRPRLIVVDKSKATFPIALHLTNNVKPQAWEEFRPGLGVAVLYPQQHGFRDRTMGIKLEMANCIQLIPLCIPALLALNDEIQTQNTRQDGKLACHACGERKATLDKCGRCELFWYCNKDCQVKDWHKGHKEDCKVLRHIKGLFTLDWEHYESFASFPL